MTNYSKLRELLIAKGMDKKWSYMFCKKLSDDEAAFSINEKTKEWALCRGFYPGRVELYGLTEDNYTNYLPDYNYFMIHPINHHFRIWVNDKLTLKYILDNEKTRELMPEYYLYIENNGDYTYLNDDSNDICKDKNYIFNLLKVKKRLAIKPNSGTSGGRGFMKMEYKNEEILINNERTSFDEFNRIINNIPNHIVTEYVVEHKDLAKIWPESECTLRVIMIKLPRTQHYDYPEWRCIVSYARFGSSISGGASNLSSGGIGIGFDFETGKFNSFGIRYKKYCSNGEWKIKEHPDTHTVWSESGLPNWDIVKNKIKDTCNCLSSLDYLGLDIIITENGMKFCEINTHPAADYEQVMCSPILLDNRNRSFFKSHGLYDVNSYDFYDLYLMSQE